MFAVAFVDRLYNVLSLSVAGLHLVEVNFFSPGSVGKNFLFNSVYVVLNQTICQCHDALRRTVVFFEFEKPCRGERMREGEDVLHTSSTE